MGNNDIYVIEILKKDDELEQKIKFLPECLDAWHPVISWHPGILAKILFFAMH